MYVGPLPVVLIKPYCREVARDLIFALEMLGIYRYTLASGLPCNNAVTFGEEFDVLWVNMWYCKWFEGDRVSSARRVSEYWLDS
jgi:hypothetical protein